MISKPDYAKKDQYNRENYDQILIRVGKGYKEKVREIAQQDGRTISNYIKMLIIKDAREKGENLDLSAFLGGRGENLTKKIMQLM